MQELQSVLANYVSTRASLEGKAIKSNTPDQDSLLLALPQFFRSILQQHGRAHEFKIEGSFGAGVIAGVPWVGIFNLAVTKSAQNGYYIVLLFAEDMSCCYLSLNQGVTAFEKTYSRKVARQKMRESAERALQYFKPDPRAMLGAIDLKATGHLAQGYERGAIESYRYDAASLPAVSVITHNFVSLLQHYDALVAVAGLSLQSLVPVSEAQYQQAVLEKATPELMGKSPVYEEPEGGIRAPTKVTNGSPGYQRNPTVAAYALKQAGFTCEIDKSHKTFISSAKGLAYVEAHHLVPMSQQSQYAWSLDISANIVALCPLCHRLLHHARPADKKPKLLKLFGERKRRLIEKGITLDERTLLGYYNKDLLEGEA